jgi:predicted HTH transcriptional regulator
LALTSMRLEAIEESQLQALVDNQVREDKHIEYKEIIDPSDDGKRKFLRVVSSFANASGGDLLVGVREDPPGIPVELAGIAPGDVDSEIQRFEALLRDGIEPRIPSVTMRPIPLSSGRSVILVRVPRSLALPHMTSFKNLSRFFSRNSSGVYQLDVGELRSAFGTGVAFRERVRQFRAERLAGIITGETPTALEDNAKLVMQFAASRVL